MKKYYYVKEGIAATRQGDFIIFVNGTVLKLTSNQALVLGLLTYKAVDFKAKLELYMNALSNKNTALAKEINETIRFMYKVDANDIEREINSTNNPALAELLGFELVSDNKTQNKPEIQVLNGVSIGQIIVILLAVFGAHSYNIECTKISEDGGVDVVTIRNISNATATLDGFESGAKYRFRSQAKLSNDVLVAFTSAVELRMN